MPAERIGHSTFAISVRMSRSVTFTEKGEPVAPCVFPRQSATMLHADIRGKTFVPDKILRKFINVEIPTLWEGAMFTLIIDKTIRRHILPIYSPSIYVKFPDGFGAVYDFFSQDKSGMQFCCCAQNTVRIRGGWLFTLGHAPDSGIVGTYYRPDEWTGSLWDGHLELKDNLKPIDRPRIILKADLT